MIASGAVGIVVGILPALMLAGGALVCGAVALARPGTRPSLYRWLTLLAAAGAFTASMIELVALRPNHDGVGVVAYSGGLMVDRLHVFGTVLVLVVLVLTLVGAETYVRRSPGRAGAFCALLQVSSAAAVMLLAQREMAAFTASFALLVVCLVLLTAMTKTSGPTAEAAFRQVLVGGIAMATTIYGLVLLYGATGSTDLSTLASGPRLDGPLVVVGMALVVIGLVVIVGVPPMQAWTRDVEEPTPGAIAGFGSALGAVTGTTVLLRFGVEGLGPGNARWTLLVTALAAIAMLTGSILALRAANIRRLIADLSIVQAGFLLLALAGTGPGIDGSAASGAIALLFALMGASVALVAALLLAGVFDAAGLAPSMEAYRGAGRRAPATAVFLSLALLSLAGLPPLAGFVGRLLIAESALNAGAGWAVGIAGIATVLAAAAVLRWLVAMYADDNREAPFAVSSTPLSSRAAAWTAAALGVLISALAGPLIALANGGAGALH